MNSLTKIVPNRAPVPMGRELSTLVAKFKNRIEEHPGHHRHFSICESLAPTGDERAVMEARREALKTALRAGDPAVIRSEISLLKAGFQSGLVDEAGANLTLQVYVEALKTCPDWTVSEACRRFRSGLNETPWKPSFCPSSAEVAAECRAIIAPIQQELSELGKVLDAHTYPEPDPEYQKRAYAVSHWLKQREEMVGKPKEAMPQETDEEMLERLRQQNASSPVVIGEGLSSKLESIKAGKKKEAA